MVTKRQLQEQIAKVLGWTQVGHPDIPGGEFLLWGYPPGQSPTETGDKFRELKTVPNWPTDRNASYELMVSLTPENSRLQPLTAREECLLYLDRERWRWVECDSCEGEPHGVSEDCTDCNGEGGKWEKASK